MRFDPQLPERLRSALADPLPGAIARAVMAPELSYGRHDGPPAWDARHAAVLLLVFSHADRWWLPLTLRPHSLAAHGGQVSLPGGEIDPGESVEQAARRELSEELGVVPENLQFLGRLTPLYVYASNYLVTPCVASSPGRPTFVPNAAEVANLIEVPLVDLAQPACRGAHTIRRYEVEFCVPHLDVEGCRVWGATSMILTEFLAVCSAAGLRV